MLHNDSKCVLHDTPVIAVFTMGGTIASSFDNRTHTIRPALSGHDLLQSLPGLDNAAGIELHEFCNMPGPHLTPEIGLRLALELRQTLQRDEVLGAVVVQGTDTLEEIAYLISLTVDSYKPIVFTGAMKSRHEAYVDGPGNLLGAIKVAANPLSRNCGVVVFFNQDIHHAQNVVKFHTNNIDAFHSLGAGPIGTICDDMVTFFYTPSQEQKFCINTIEPKVTLIKAAFGMDDTLIRAGLEAGTAGIVIEGLGAGNLPPHVLPAVQKAIELNIPVVLVSRCVEGKTLAIYDYEGGGAKLREMGIILGGSLNGQKARVKLMVVLGYSRDMSEIRRCFEESGIVLKGLANYG